MSKIVNIAEKQIIDSVTAALKQNMADGTFIEAEIPAFKTEIPADKNNGDYSANAAFMLSKALRMPPRKIAEEIQRYKACGKDAVVIDSCFLTDLVDKKLFDSIVCLKRPYHMRLQAVMEREKEALDILFMRLSA